MINFTILCLKCLEKKWPDVVTKGEPLPTKCNVHYDANTLTYTWQCFLCGEIEQYKAIVTPGPKPPDQKTFDLLNEKENIKKQLGEKESKVYN